MPTARELIQSALASLQGGRVPEAVGSLRAALDAEPEHPVALRLLGEVEFRSGRGEEAIGLFERAVRAGPGDPQAWFSLGAGCAISGRFDRAAEAFGKVVELQPGNAVAIACLGKAQQTLKRIDDAIATYNRALEVQPTHAEARVDLGNCYMEIGRPDLAIGAYRKVLEFAPDHIAAHDCLCTTLNYPSGVAPEEVFAAHRAYGEAVMRLPPLQVRGPEPAASGPGRRLRVGYLSGDMYEHSVSYFLRPMLRHRDRESFEVVCYHTGPKIDQATAEIESLADEYRHVRGLNDAQLASQIRADRIDILIELSGHSFLTRLPMLRARVAPVTVTYCGYPNTTGLPTVDHRVVDSLTDPPEADAFCTERLVRLPGCFLCYEPRNDVPAVSPAPCEASGFVTFGSFNAIKKVTPQVVGLWGRVLREVPGSRLVLKGAVFSSEQVCRRYLGLFAEHGVEAGRVDLLPRLQSQNDHLDAYRLIDIGLDPFPYNGTTTTCEAMWMGVPVLTRVGDRHASRVGLSLLTAVGMERLAAGDDEAFVESASRLAGDRSALASLRRTLRERVAASPLCDGPAFMKGFEAALRGMWREACGRAGSPA